MRAGPSAPLLCTPLDESSSSKPRGALRSNYGVQTTSAVEWAFVVGEDAVPAGLARWPVEAEEKLPDRSRCRRKTPLAALEEKAEQINVKLKEANQPELLREEIIAANLYTGPVRRSPFLTRLGHPSPAGRSRQSHSD